MKIKYLTMISSMMIFIGCENSSDPIEIEKYNLTGRVIDQLTDSSIAIVNASVILDDITIQSDSNGIFSFSDVKRGDHQLVISSEGYIVYDTVINVLNDMTLDFNLTQTSHPLFLNDVGNWWRYIVYSLNNGNQVIDTLTIKIIGRDVAADGKVVTHWKYERTKWTLDEWYGIENDTVFLYVSRPFFHELNKKAIKYILPLSVGLNYIQFGNGGEVVADTSIVVPKGTFNNCFGIYFILTYPFEHYRAYDYLWYNYEHGIVQQFYYRQSTLGGETDAELWKLEEYYIKRN